MKDIYLAELAKTYNMSSESDKLSYLNSITRSILQTAAIVSLEIVRRLIPNSDTGNELDYLASRFQQPSDGLPLEILDKVAPIIRSLISDEYLKGWFEKYEGESTNLATDILKWVEFRNKVLAHGVVDKNDIKEWSPKMAGLIRRCLIVFSQAIPAFNPDRHELLLSGAYSSLSINTPLIINNKAVVVKKVTFKKSLWKVQGQVLCWDNAAEFTSDLQEANVFSEQGFQRQNKFKYSQIIKESEKFSLLQNIPTRQTSTFEGRKKELARLTKWLNEPEESRSCLIFGDGGYGKTTLVLEFLNKLIDGVIEVTAGMPEIISYHTAKMTKWTDQGITHFRGISNAMEDGIREIMYCLQDVLGKEWYRVEGVALIDKVRNELATQGYSRNDLLLVLDNTETLATSVADREELTDFFDEVARKIGRIILTSRRRELMNVTPIQVSALTEEESIQLLRRLGAEHCAKPIMQAGDARLRRVSSQLSHKPLLMDALVKYIARASVGIDDALSSIFRKSNDQLLEFLYEDAWLRMSESQRHVYLILVSITCPVDEFSVGYACQEIGIPHDEFHQSLDETYFANLTSYGQSYELEIVDLAHNFFLQKLSKLPSLDKGIIQNCAKIVDEHAKEREKVELEYKNDRVAEAFRGQYAKAAKIATDKGKIADARDLFEMAIQDDSMNAALHDRFAWFLLHRAHDLDEAFNMARKAVNLDEKNPDALLTLAIILYHKSDVESADNYIQKANNLGKSNSLCLLRMGIGRYQIAKKISDKTAIPYLEKAIDCFNRSNREIKYTDRYYTKNRNELNKYLALSQNALHILRSNNPTHLSEVAPNTNLSGFDPA
ncbi:NB-ARC domain-containing protein [Pseudomonas sp. MF4836]|uniref:NB-ARC domain-containing protein n=1 Tax=Pseudomonas sp. MF4836 TaxID=1960827 RepID=UPI0012908432|nr:NB-ARC domain-containing protein [Pseudomonas sp. MF4836]